MLKLLFEELVGVNQENNREKKAFHTEEIACAKDLWHSKCEKLQRNQCNWKREAQAYMVGGKTGVQHTAPRRLHLGILSYS